MKFQLSSQFLSLGTKYQIKDEYGNPAYTLTGKFLSFGNNLAMETADGIPVARIEQRLLKLVPTFDLMLGDKHYATISRKFSWFKKSFLLDVPGPNDYDIEGSFWNYEYEFRRLSKVVATVSRKFFSTTNAYGVDINKSKEPVSILVTAVVIDLCNRSGAAAAAGAAGA